MFNIIRSNESIPKSIQIFEINEKALQSGLSECRRAYLELGWNLWKEKKSIYLLNLNPDNINKPPEYIEPFFDILYPFRKKKYTWNENSFSRNVFAFAFFATLEYQTKFRSKIQVKRPSELGLRKHRHEFLFPTPIISIEDIPVFKGISFRPIILKDEDRNFPAFLVNRIIRVKSGIKGSPKNLLTLSSLRTVLFFRELSSILKKFETPLQNLCIGNFKFSINTDFTKLNILEIEKEEESDEIFEEEEYTLEDEEYTFTDEEELCEDESEEIIEEFKIPKEILDESLPIFPISIHSYTLQETSLTVGGNFCRKKMTTMYMLEKYGPFSAKNDLSVVFVPIYPSNQPSIRNKLIDFCNHLINGTRVNQYQFPGFNKCFNISSQSVDPYEISTQSDSRAFKYSIEAIIREVRSKIPQLEKQYTHLSNAIPFFIFGQQREKRIHQGEFTPSYRFVKQQLTEMGIPNQTVVRFDTLNYDKWRIYPLWSIASQIFSKIGGVPWVIESHLDRNMNPIHAIIGIRFAKRYNPINERKYILGVLSIITSDGRFKGFITDSFDYSKEIEEYNWISRQHGLTHFYDGLKLSPDDVKKLCSEIVSFLKDKMGLIDQSGSIIIHRLGLVPKQEQEEFKRFFDRSSFNLALISISHFSLRHCSPKGDIQRGTLFKIDDKSAYLFTQGSCQYNTSPTTRKTFKPRSCPSALSLKLTINDGVYSDIVDASSDVLSLTRMNWRHTTYVPTNFPVSLQYALLVAQNKKNEIEPKGDYRELPWFL